MLMAAQPSTPLSKFAFCELVLDSALELEKARTGGIADPVQLGKLADALTRTAMPFAQDANKISFVEAGYFGPLGRLFTTCRDEQPQSTKQIQDFVEDAAKNMRAPNFSDPSNRSISQLIEFCAALHEELARDLDSENRIVIDEWRSADDSTEACLS